METKWKTPRSRSLFPEMCGRRSCSFRYCACLCAPHHSWNSYELVSFGLVSGEQSIGGPHGLRTVRSHFFVTSVVKQDHVAASNLFFDSLFDLRCGRSIPVVARNIPHDRFKAELAGDAEDRGAASPKGRAEESGVLAGSVAQSGVAVR